MRRVRVGRNFKLEATRASHWQPRPAGGCRAVPGTLAKSVGAATRPAGPGTSLPGWPAGESPGRHLAAPAVRVRPGDGHGTQSGYYASPPVGRGNPRQRHRDCERTEAAAASPATLTEPRSPPGPPGPGPGVRRSGAPWHRQWQARSHESVTTHCQAQCGLGYRATATQARPPRLPQSDSRPPSQSPAGPGRVTSTVSLARSRESEPGGLSPGPA
jgi:hypothetical protein